MALDGDTNPENAKNGPPALSRRTLFAAGAGAAAASIWQGNADPLIAPPAQAASKGPSTLTMQNDGGYATVPLAKDSISIGIVQSRVIAVDTDKPEKKRRDNVAHMCDLIDYASGFSGKKDLLFFHEFPITGYNYKWTLADARRVAIEIPGEETEALAKKAREHGSWLVFGSYVRDPDWPESLLSITTIMNDKGEIVDKHWKARNIKGVFFGFELFTTTVYDVLDRYIEMYGPDQVIPVTRTPLGNIATSSIQREPEYFRALAMKGAEIMLRTATGGFTPADIAATSLYNQVYTAIANNSASPDNGLYFEDAGGGGSGLYGPDGEAMEIAPTAFETCVSARIPIRSFRDKHRQPLIHSDLYMPVFSAYQSKYPPNLFSAYQPKDIKDSGRYLKDKSRWK
jgi:predicted amidohydrolase